MNVRAVEDQEFPVGRGAPTSLGGDANLRHGHFSVETYAKMKELGPVGGGGGGGTGGATLDPPLKCHLVMSLCKFDNLIL